MGGVRGQLRSQGCEWERFDLVAPFHKIPQCPPRLEDSQGRFLGSGSLILQERGSQERLASVIDSAPLSRSSLKLWGPGGWEVLSYSLCPVLVLFGLFSQVCKARRLALQLRKGNTATTNQSSEAWSGASQP